MFDTELAIKAQKELCDEKQYPHFAPLGSGRCYSCKRNIFSEGGISVESARKFLITGCPFCHRSYCD